MADDMSLSVSLRLRVARSASETRRAVRRLRMQITELSFGYFKLIKAVTGRRLFGLIERIGRRAVIRYFQNYF